MEEEISELEETTKNAQVSRISNFEEQSSKAVDLKVLKLRQGVSTDDDDDDVIGEEQNPMVLSTEEKKGAFKGPGDHMLAAPILEVDDDVESVFSPDMQQVKYMAQ